MGDEVCEFMRAVGHAELFCCWPLVDLRTGELDPSFDALEHLDLECCEQH